MGGKTEFSEGLATVADAPRSARIGLHFTTQAVNLEAEKAR